MEQYWNAHQTTSHTAPTKSHDDVVQPDKSILSEFDHHRLSLLSANQNDEEGWRSEMCQYLKDLTANVTKDTDIVKWWQVCVGLCMYYSIMLNNHLLQDNGATFPTLCCIALDFLPCQASSVACERLFLAGGEVATKR